jgi:hypothetical protein
MTEQRTDNRTEQELIQEAILVQNACNLSGVVHSFSRAISRLWVIANETGGRGTDWINRHRVSRLYADKIQSLAGQVHLGDFNETDLENR